MKTTMDISLQNKTSIKVKNILIVAAATFLVGMFVVAALPLTGVSPCDMSASSNVLYRVGKIFTKCPPHSNVNSPLVIHDVQAVYSDLFDHLFGSNIPSYTGGQIYLSSGDAKLGSLDLNSNLHFTDGSASSDSVHPLKVGIQDGSTLRDQHLTIAAGDVAHTICLPAMSEGRYFYFDANGSPYFDASLSQPALSTSCANLLAQGLSVNVHDAELTATYDSKFDYYAVVRGNFWQEPIWEFGCLHQNSFQTDCISPNSYNLAIGQSPLVIAPHPSQQAVAPVTTPADVLTVWDAYNVVKNICVPSVTLTDSPLDSEAMYITNTGDAYQDAFFQTPTFVGCQQVLEKGAKPKKVFSASTTVLPEFGAIAFARGSVRDPHLLGWLRYDEGWSAGDLPESAQVLQGKAPLTIALQNLADGKTIQWSEQTISISTDIGNYSFCIPSQTLVPGPKLFYLDKLSNVYSDALLQNIVTCNK